MQESISISDDAPLHSLESVSVPALKVMVASLSVTSVTTGLVSWVATASGVWPTCLAKVVKEYSAGLVVETWVLRLSTQVIW